MDLGFIDLCMKSYNGKLSEEDAKRLQFFRGLWDVMAEASEMRPSEAYKVPSLDELKELYRAGIPVFDKAPVEVDAHQFAETAQHIAGYLAESGNYDQELADDLVSVEWAGVFEAAEEGARSVDELFERLFEQLVEAAESAPGAQLLALVASMALYTFYEGPAHAIMDAIGYDDVIAEHPLLCPVCGGEPMLASVGEKTSSAGRGRLLYCLRCGAAWEFDRVRCAHCGTHDQTKLHFVSIEGDDDHRLALCEECGGFMRTTFIESNLFPISSLVEDVVMAPLAVLGTEHMLQREAASDGQS